MIKDNKYYLRDFDTARVTESERIYCGTRTLKEIREFLTEQNGKDKGLLIFPKSNKVKVIGK